MGIFNIAAAQHFNFLPSKFTMQIIIKIAIFFLHCSRLVVLVFVAFCIKMQMLWINLHVAPLSAIISDSLLRLFSHCCCCCYCWCWQTMRCFCFWKGFSLTVVEWGSSRRGRQREKCYKNSSDGGIFSCACVKASSFRCACQSSARRMFAHVSACARGKGESQSFARCLFVCGSLRIPRNLLTSRFTHKQTHSHTGRHTHTYRDRDTDTEKETASRTWVSTVLESPVHCGSKCIKCFCLFCSFILCAFKLKVKVDLYLHLSLSFTCVLNYIRVPSDRFFVHIERQWKEFEICLIKVSGKEQIANKFYNKRNSLKFVR